MQPQKNYGATNPVFGLAYTGFANSDTESDLDVIPTASTTANDLSVVGTYSVIVSGGSDNNYEYAFTAGQLTVQKAVLEVTANNQSVVYNDAIPTLTKTYSGFANSENETTLNTAPAISTIAVQGSDAGNYDITLSGGAADNYTINLTNGSLAIIKASQQIEAQAVATKLTTDGPFDIISSTSSGLALQYTISEPATIGGTTVTLNGLWERYLLL